MEKSSHHCPFLFLHNCSLFLEVFAIIKSVSDKDLPYFSGKLWVTIHINKQCGGASLTVLLSFSGIISCLP